MAGGAKEIPDWHCYAPGAHGASPCARCCLFQLYDMYSCIMQYLPGRHNRVYYLIEDLKDFIAERVRANQATLDLNSPRDFIDCFLIQMEKVFPAPAPSSAPARGRLGTSCPGCRGRAGFGVNGCPHWARTAWATSSMVLAGERVPYLDLCRGLPG